MKHSVFHKIWNILYIVALLAAFSANVSAQETEDPLLAQDISSRETVADFQGFGALTGLFDKKEQTPGLYLNDSWLTLSHPDGIGSVYMILETEYGSIHMLDNDTGREVTVDTQGMVHLFVDLTQWFGDAPQSITLSFQDGDVPLNELYIFTPGQVPDWVQIWQEPLEANTDLLLFSAHGDDEQLFFAGLLPYYAGEQGCRVQVAYLTDHRGRMPFRMHEMLNGLWAVGVRAYPVFGRFPDFLSKSLESAYEGYRAAGVEEEDVLAFVVEQLRRFCPLVAVTHDVNGEYGHGMHMMYADCLMKASALSKDANAFPESAEKYGTWDTPKIYLHMYGENAIRMDWDKPLSHFGGKTAFEVSRDIGFPCHVSQYPDFIWYYTGVNSAAEVPEYNPCDYGLYYSLVGKDTWKTDMFEHLLTRAELEEYPAPEIPDPEAAEAIQTDPTTPETVLPLTEEKAAASAEINEYNGNPFQFAAIAVIAALLSVGIYAFWTWKKVQKN